jgi:hypothetical protein
LKYGKYGKQKGIGLPAATLFAHMVKVLGELRAIDMAEYYCTLGEYNYYCTLGEYYYYYCTLHSALCTLSG